MANPDHTSKLREGAKIWNEWRKENLTVIPDLSKADLSGAKLSGANLSKANRSEANLSAADLSEANLSGADLSGAKLSETVFGNTDLRRAQGLDACSHFGPSTIDHRTLSRSGR